MAYPTHDIKSIEYRILPNHEEQKMSASNIVDRRISINGDKSANTLFDRAMGVAMDSQKCATCGLKQSECPKHFGTIQLQTPILNPAKFNLSEVLKLLNVICWKCGKCRCEPTKVVPNYYSIARISRLSQLARAITLNTDPEKKNKAAYTHCGFESPRVIYRKSNRAQFFAYLPYYATAAINEIALFPQTIAEVLARIDRETLTLLGKDSNYSPTELVRNNIHVMPSNLRSSTPMTAGGHNSVDPITRILSEVLKYNDALKVELLNNKIPPLESILSLAEKDKSAYTYERNKTLLNIIALITNANHAIIYGKALVKESSAVACDRSISKEVNGKEGIIRHSGLGARISNTARAVIYNETRLPLGGVLLPVFFASRMYIKETVNERNYFRMRQLLVNGNKTYPGCLEVIRPSTGQKFILPMINADVFDLLFGDIVKRHIMEGDYILLNRQPSVLTSNICMFRVYINPSTTAYGVGVNIGNCELFNLDFDGDQMSIFTVATPAGIAEGCQLNQVKNYFMSEQYSKPSIGFVQDAITLMAELTRDGVRLSRYEVALCLENTKTIVDLDRDEYTGREVVSLLLPTFDYRAKSSYSSSPLSKYIKVSESETIINIEQGHLLSGVLDKSSLSDRKGSIFHVIFDQYGVDKTFDVFYDLQQLAFSYGRLATFSTSPRDFIISDANSISRIHSVITKTLLDVQPIIAAYQSGQMIAPPDKTLTEHFEERMMGMLKAQPYEAIVNALTQTSGLIKLIMYGARGNPENMLNMCGLVGMALVRGEIIKPDFDLYRMSPFIHRCDQEPTSRGFIVNPYMSGLTPVEVLYNAMESRVKVMQKSLEVTSAGVIARLTTRNSESLVLSFLMMVMRGKTVVEWSYGDCNLNPAKISEYSIPSIKLSNEAFEREYKFSNVMPKLYGASVALKKCADDEYAQLSLDRQTYRDYMFMIEASMGKMYFTDNQRFPVNMAMFLESAMKAQGGPIEQDAKTVVESYNVVHRAIERLHARVYSIHLPDDAVFPHCRQTLRFFEMYLRCWLCLKNLAVMTPSSVKSIITLIHVKLYEAFMAPGAGVGIIMAAAMSQPITQKQLDSAHVIGANRVTQYSLEMIRDFIHFVDTTLKGTAQMWMRVRPEIEGDFEAVKNVARRIELITLGAFVTAHQTFYEEFGKPEHSKYMAEAAIYDEFRKASSHRAPSNISKFCIRFDLNRHIMLIKGVSVVQIVSAIYQTIPNVYIVHTTENDLRYPLMLRVHIVHNRTFNRIHHVDDLRAKLINCVVRGIRGIREALVIPTNINELTADGTVKIREIFMIRTIGSNTIGLLGEPDIIPETIQTNSMNEVNRMFGMVATRFKIIQEFGKILDNLNPIHFTLMADNMTFTGTLTPLNRAGVLMREFNNVLLNSATGYPMAVLAKAATVNTKNELYGLSGKMLAGQQIGLGTGYVKTGMALNSEASELMRKSSIRDGSVLDAI